ncbi:MAG TPA: anthranilate synthase component I family protein, partial [Phycisphaerae bacterium]|nr:anthranilate synthase component I family protein [Phycisphaerae bacterium]
MAAVSRLLHIPHSAFRTEEVPWPADAEALFARLARRRGCVWLDSAGGPANLARWSVLAAEPSAVLVHQGGVSRFVAPDGRAVLEPHENPFDALRAAVRAARFAGGHTHHARSEMPGEDPPFGPGFYGYLAYDLGPYVEPTAPLSPTRDIALPDLWFGYYETVLVLDHAERRAVLIGADGPPAAGHGTACGRAREALGSALAEADGPADWLDAAQPAREASCNFTRAAYLAAVARAREYIAAGDIFQVNLSRRFTVPLEPCAPGPDPRPASLYRHLRHANPAPYAAYIGLGAGRAVLSSSPELFLDPAAGCVVTRPIKGTRPRHAAEPESSDFNRRERDNLLRSEKDKAELVMITDLERNDIGRVCDYGSVRVTNPRAVEAYETVYHTVATVEGRLHAEADVVDLLRATFPGGSITGAPKVRAMQIIAELEPTRRSVYTGAVGYLAPPSDAEPAGRCSLNIAIRTLLVAGQAVHLQAGGGIVADSDPAAEFDETSDKA